MPADEHVSPIQFITYHDVTEALGRSTRTHQVRAYGRTGFQVGAMTWTAKEIGNIHADIPRRGIATALWNEGHRLAAENRRIPTPKHSALRTEAGDAWARSVGGRLPRRK